MDKILAAKGRRLARETCAVNMLKEKGRWYEKISKTENFT